MEYEVLYAENLNTLKGIINGYISCGWKKLGGITICSREQYYITMVK